jgi:hypothetical protein
MATPTGIDTVRPNAVVRQQVPIAATTSDTYPHAPNKNLSSGPADRASTNGRTMYTEHFHIYIIDSPTRHNISHLDKRSSLVHYHRTILYSSIHVCYNSGEVIYCVCVSSGAELAHVHMVRSCPARSCPRDRDWSAIGGCVGPLRQGRPWLALQA